MFGNWFGHFGCFRMFSNHFIHLLNDFGPFWWLHTSLVYSLMGLQCVLIQFEGTGWEAPLWISTKSPNRSNLPLKRISLNVTSFNIRSISIYLEFPSFVSQRFTQLQIFTITDDQPRYSAYLCLHRYHQTYKVGSGDGNRNTPAPLILHTHLCISGLIYIALPVFPVNRNTSSYSWLASITLEVTTPPSPVETWLVMIMPRLLTAFSFCTVPGKHMRGGSWQCW